MEWTSSSILGCVGLVARAQEMKSEEAINMKRVGISGDRLP